MKSLFAGVVFGFCCCGVCFCGFFSFPSLLWFSLDLVERRGNDKPTKRDVTETIKTSEEVVAISCQHRECA